MSVWRWFDPCFKGIWACDPENGQNVTPQTVTSKSPAFVQKNPRVRKIRVRNSGAGDGCVNFMDAWKNAFFLQEKTMSIKFLVLGGGYFGFGGGGSVKCRFYFYGREDFSDFVSCR